MKRLYFILPFHRWPEYSVKPDTLFIQGFLSIRIEGGTLKKFVFPLEKVLAVREMKRLIAEEKLGGLLREMHVVKDALSIAESARLDNQASLRIHLLKSVDLGQVKALLVYGNAISEDISNRKEELVYQESMVRKAQEEVLARTQEKRALERLKEKQISLHRSMYWWEQGKQLDEIGTMYFNRSEKEVN